MEGRTGNEGMSEAQSAKNNLPVSYGFKSPYTNLYNSPSVPSLQGKQLGAGLFSPLMPSAMDSNVSAATSMSAMGKNAQFTLDITRDINNTIINATGDIATLPGTTIDDTPSSELHPLQVAEQMLVQYQKDIITNPQLALLSQQQAKLRQEQARVGEAQNMETSGIGLQGNNMGYENSMNAIGGVAPTPGINPTLNNNGLGMTGIDINNQVGGIGQNGLQYNVQNTANAQMTGGLTGVNNNNNNMVGSTLGQVQTLLTNTNIQQGFEPNHLCAFRAIFFNVEGSDSAISVATEEDEEVNKIREQLILQQKNQQQQQQQQLLLLQQQQQQYQMGSTGLGAFGSMGSGLGLGGGLGATTMGLNNGLGTGLGTGFGGGFGGGIGGSGLGMGITQPMGINLNVGASNPSLLEQINLINQLSQLNSVQAANHMPGVGEVPFPFDESSWLAALSSLKKYNKARSSDPNYVPLVPVMLRGTDEIKARATKLLALTNLVKDYTNFINSSLQTKREDEDDCEMLRQSVQGMRRRLISLVGKLSAGSGGLYGANAAGKWADLNKQLTVKLHNINDTVTELKIQADENLKEVRKEAAQKKGEVYDEEAQREILEKLQSQSHALLKLAKEVTQMRGK